MWQPSHTLQNTDSTAPKMETVEKMDFKQEKKKKNQVNFVKSLLYITNIQII